MKKVINITIGGVVFAVNDDAYEKLSYYLERLKKHFKKDKDGEEILEDIEASIADKFLEMKKSEKIAISDKDVEQVIEAMGSLKEIEGVEEEAGEESEATVKKLYRDPDDVIIAGVGSGLAAYFGIDTVWVRLVFFISIFFGGLGLIVYIILWMIMPEATTTAQKLEMRGEPVTLYEIEKLVKEGVQKLKKKSQKGGKDGSRDLGDVFGRIVRVFGKIIVGVLLLLRYVIGVGLIVGGVLSILALSFALAWLFSGNGIPYSDVLVTDFVDLQGNLYWLFVLGLYVLVLGPMLLLILLGASFLKGRSVIDLFLLVSILVFWFVALGYVSSVVFENRMKIEGKVLEIIERVETGVEQMEKLNGKLENLGEHIDEDTFACIQIYDPVCGVVEECEGEDCLEKKETFPNSCLAELSGAKEVASGECE